MRPPLSNNVDSFRILHGYFHSSHGKRHNLSGHFAASLEIPKLNGGF